MDAFKEYAYPKNNYNFDYKNYVAKNYRPDKLGISDSPTIPQFKHNLEASSIYGDTLYEKSIPHPNDVPGISDARTPEELSEGTKNLSQAAPYRRFRQEYPENKYPTKGKYGNSYFVQSGYCPVKSAKSASECRAKDPRYIWKEGQPILPTPNIPFYNKMPDNPYGKCYKPRYSYVNNTSDAGLVPSLMDDVFTLSPSNFYRLIAGEPIPSVNKDSVPLFQLLPCVEEFTNYTQEKKPKHLTFISVFALVAYFSLVYILWITY